MFLEVRDLEFVDRLSGLDGPLGRVDDLHVLAPEPLGAARLGFDETAVDARDDDVLAGVVIRGDLRFGHQFGIVLCVSGSLVDLPLGPENGRRPTTVCGYFTIEPT